MTIAVTGIQHVGIPVRSMERSLEFYRDVLGLELDFVAESGGPEVSQLVGLNDAAMSFAFLRIGSHIVELLEYHSPRGRDYDRRNCDVGAVHIAFEVPDIDAAYATLVEKGVVVSTPPVRIQEGPLAGCAVVYFKDPDGVQLEAFQVPAGSRTS